MALVSVSSKCFNAVETALAAVKTGDISNAMVTLKSIRQDGLLLQREASVLLHRLRRAVDEHQRKVEDLTRQMNELYHDQKQHEKSKTELEARKSSLTNEKERSNQSKQDASRRYREAEKEKREAEKKYEELEKYWWVPVYGTFLAVREIVEDNQKKANAAYREMESHERDMQRADRDIAWANSGISEAENTIKRILGEVENLKRRREECHKQLGDVKSMVAFIMQAETFWNEVAALTKTATVKTEHIQRIAALAAKKNTATILKSRGTQIMTSSFKECWMEVSKMITSDDNNLILTGEGNAFGTLMLEQ